MNLCICTVALLMTDLSGVKQGQQRRCKVKQETIDLKFLLGSAYTRMIIFFKLEGVVWLAMTDKIRKQYFWAFLISAMYSANGVLKKIYIF